MMGNRPVCLRSPVPKPIQKQCRARRLPMVLQSAHPPGPSVPSLSGPLCPFVPLSLPFRPCLSGPLCPFVPLSLPFRPCLSAPCLPHTVSSPPTRLWKCANLRNFRAFNHLSCGKIPLKTPSRLADSLFKSAILEIRSEKKPFEERSPRGASCFQGELRCHPPVPNTPIPPSAAALKPTSAPTKPNSQSARTESAQSWPPRPHTALPCPSSLAAPISGTTSPASAMAS